MKVTVLDTRSEAKKRGDTRCIQCELIQTPIIEKTDDGWRWRCPRCGECRTGFRTEEEAREAWNETSDKADIADLTKTAKSIGCTLEELQETLGFMRLQSEYFEECDRLKKDERYEDLERLHLTFTLQTLDIPVDEESIKNLRAARQECEQLPEEGRTEEARIAVFQKYGFDFSNDMEVGGNR